MMRMRHAKAPNGARAEWREACAASERGES
jgi:hypothetical protein